MAASSALSPEFSALEARIAQKELDYNELQSLFTKYKLKQKVKYDKLREEIHAYFKKNGGGKDKENAALLMVRASETDAKLEEVERRSESLQRELQRRETQVNDQRILIRNLEEQLRVRRPLSENERSEKRRMAELVDMDSIHAQIVYKDERIVELNNVILDKERQILDLQELVKEHDQVASSKKQAMRLVQKRFEELESITRRSVGTETDFTQVVNAGSLLSSRGRNEIAVSNGRVNRGSSPGRAIKGHGASSPPPLDPSEDLCSEGSPIGASSAVEAKRISGEEKKRKRRVTFDLPLGGTVEPGVSSSIGISLADVVPDHPDEIERAVNEITRENKHLKEVIEQYKKQLLELQCHAEEAGSEAARNQKGAVAKAKVAAQARIRDLEGRMGDLNAAYSAQVERMQAELEALRGSREWEIEENARLREQIAKIKEKNGKLTSEVDAAVVVSKELQERMMAEHMLMEEMMNDLEHAETVIVQNEEEREQIDQDMERMRGAIFAQEQFIEILEADIVIYEEHIGILRESLGASKVDHRDLIRSKAFEAKLKALEEEKQEIARNRQDERLKTKALNAKVRMLEAENEKLMARVCEMEMGTAEGHHDETLLREKGTLELQLVEADRRMNLLREQFDQEMANARHEADVSARQASLLRDSVDRLQSELSTSVTQSGCDDRSWSENQQTIVGVAEAGIGNEEIDGLKQRLDEATVALLQAEETNSRLSEQISEIGAENFELRGRLAALSAQSEELETLRRTVVDLKQGQGVDANEQEHHRQTVFELVGIKERFRQLECDLSESRVQADEMRRRAELVEAELKTLKGLPVDYSVVEIEDASHTTEMALLLEENKRLKEELDHARLSISETREVQKEVEQLKVELEEERNQSDAKWSEMCEKLLNAATDGEDTCVDRSSRKASLDEMHSYLDAYADKCRKLEDDLKDARERIEQTMLEATSTTEESALIGLRHALEVVERDLAESERIRAAEESRRLQLETELATAWSKIEADKVEKKKLKAAVKQLRNRSGTMDQRLDRVSLTGASSARPEVETDTSTEEIQELRARLTCSEMESRLSTELNLQLDQTIQELEEQLAQLAMEKEVADKKVVDFEFTLGEERTRAREAENALRKEIDTLLEEQQELSFRAEAAEESFNSDELCLKVQSLEQELCELRAQLALESTRREEAEEKMQENQQQIQSLQDQNVDLAGATKQLEEMLKRQSDEPKELLSAAEELHYPHNVANEETVVDENIQSTQCMHASLRSLHEALLRASAATTNAATVVLEDKFETGGRINDYSSGHAYCALDHNYCHSSSPGASVPDLSAPSVSFDSTQLNTAGSHATTNAASTGDVAHLVRNADTFVEECRQDGTCDRPSWTGGSVSDHSYFSAQAETPATQMNAVVTTSSTNPTTSATHGETAVPVLTTNTERDLFAENQLLRECVNETTRMHDSLGEDMEKLQELRSELENAVEGLQGEIWSLNGQLKASVLDRENLGDRLADLDSRLMSEKKRADQLDQELSEQVELTEKAQRQAAESENESNRRLAECLEMESRREQIEKAYAQLMEYYTQLHSSYEALYKSIHSTKTDTACETDLSSTDVTIGQEALRLYHVYRDQFDVTSQQVGMLRNDLRSLAHDIVFTGLSTLETSICSCLARIQAALRKLEEAESSSSSHGQLAVEAVVDSVIEECDLRISTRDLDSKVEQVVELLKKKLLEVEESRKAVAEQRRVCSALEMRLAAAECQANTRGDFEGTLRSSEMALREREHEVEELKEHVNELKTSLEELTTSHSQSEAARLATRQADVDALFRANAELAHTNVRLQNELDELASSLSQTDRTDLERLRAYERKCEAQRSIIEAELLSARQEITELNAIIDSYGSTIHNNDLTDLQTEADLLRVEVQRLSGVEALLNETIVELEQKLSASEANISGHEEMLKEDLHKTSSAVFETNPQTSTDETNGWGWEDEDSTGTNGGNGEPSHPAVTLDEQTSSDWGSNTAETVLALRTVPVKEEHDDANENERAALKEKVDSLSTQLIHLEEEFLNKLEAKEMIEEQLREYISELESKAQANVGRGEDRMSSPCNDDAQLIEESSENVGWDDEGWGEDQSEGEEKQSEQPNTTEAENRRLESTVQELREEVDRLRIIAESAATQDLIIEQLRDELVLARNELGDLQSQLMELQKVNSAHVEVEEASCEGWGWNEDVVLATEAESTTSLHSKIGEQQSLITQLEARLGEQDGQAAATQRELQQEAGQLLERLRQSDRDLIDARLLLEEREVQMSALRSNVADCETLNSALEAARTEVISDMQLLKKELEVTMKKCSLLMDSEARLLDQVDEYGAEADKHREEVGRLQEVVNGLEAQLGEVEMLRERAADLEGQVERASCGQLEVDGLRLELEMVRGLLHEKESRLDDVIAEKAHVERELQNVLIRLREVEQERDSIRRSFDELRNRIAARRRAVHPPSASGASRRSSVASTADHEIPEEPVVQRTSFSPAVITPPEASNSSTQGVATEEAFRRRGQRRHE